LKEMESQSSSPPAYWRIKKRRGFSYPFKGVRNEEEPRGYGYKRNRTNKSVRLVEKLLCRAHKKER
jgi:hypothetical protein